jgi:pentatricopeptide repeat protein
VIQFSLNLKNRVLSVRDSSQLIENLINANRVGEAFKLTKEMLANKMIPLTRVFRYMLNKLASIGDIDGIVEVGHHLDEVQPNLHCILNRLINFL